MIVVQESVIIAIQSTLRCFGITRRYKGYLYLCHCIELAVANDFRLSAITKEIYMAAAAAYDCEWRTVERNIRTLAARAWRVNAPLLEQLAGYSLESAPSASEFIEILTTHVLRGAESLPTRTIKH